MQLKPSVVWLGMEMVYPYFKITEIVELKT